MLHINTITTNVATTSALAYVCEYIEECQQEHEDIVIDGLMLHDELFNMCWQCYELKTPCKYHSWL